MAQSYGFVETQGLVGSIEAADAMLKAAGVRLVQKREIGFGLVTVIVEGELGAVQAAIDAGKEAALRIGQFITSHVIAHPFNDTERLVMQKLGLNHPAEKEDKKLIEIKIKEVKAKKAKPVKQKKLPEEKAQAQSDEDKIIAFLKENKNGATVDFIAASLNQDIGQTRILLKQLIDLQKIEKVQQRYYTL
ncbi:MAG: BMC domain-containing protein [Calditrichaeota bacterium]|nr:BMC domain-containing protein [Calditrichota bacterium]